MWYGGGGTGEAGGIPPKSNRQSKRDNPDYQEIWDRAFNRGYAEGFSAGVASSSPDPPPVPVVVPPPPDPIPTRFQGVHGGNYIPRRWREARELRETPANPPTSSTSTLTELLLQRPATPASEAMDADAATTVLQGASFFGAVG